MRPRIPGSRTLPLLLAALCVVAAADAQPAAEADTSSRRRVVRHPAPPQLVIVPLAGEDPAHPTDDDLQALRKVIGDARVVALGETFHTSGGFYRLKHRVFRFLVEEMGFRAFAIESLWQGAERADAYIQSGFGTAEQAIADHINVWQSREYADLVRWMREWNRTHPAAEDKLTLFGFDIQQPWYDGPALSLFLDRIGIPPSDPRSEGLRSCEAAFGTRYPFGEIPSHVHATCIEALDAIEHHFQANREEIERRTTKSSLATATLRLIGLRAWQNSVYTIRDNFAAGYNFRDEAMAYAFHAQRAAKAPNAKTVVWAANSHVAKNPLPEGEIPIGSHLEQALGADYVTFAIAAYDTQIDFPGYPCGAATRHPGSVEEQLAAYGHPALLAWYDGGGPAVTAPMGVNVVRPWRDYDGILFLQHSPKMHPLLWAPCK